MNRLLPFLLTICTMLAAGNSQAQYFTMPYDTVRAEYTGGDGLSGDPIEKYSNPITNVTTSDVRLVWKIKDHNFPSSWSTSDVLGICDNVLCYTDVASLFNGTEYPTDAYAPGVPGIFYLQLDLSSAVTGTHFLTINLKEEQGRQSKDVTFLISKHPAGVAGFSRVDNSVTLYPNPAKNMVNLSFNAQAGVRNVGIYNLIGKLVSTHKVASGAGKTAIDINHVPAGIYYVKLLNSQGEVIATRRFTRQ